MKCAACGRNDLPLVTFVSAETNKAEMICPLCMEPEQTGKSPMEALLYLDDNIRMLEESNKQLEELSAFEGPSMKNIPKEMAAFALTPTSMYKAAQVVIASLKSRRLDLLATLPGEQRLQYELERALAQQNYERSAVLRDELKRRGA